MVRTPPFSKESDIPVYLSTEAQDSEMIIAWAHLFEIIGAHLRSLRTLDIGHCGFRVSSSPRPFNLMIPLSFLSDLRSLSLAMGHAVIIPLHELVALVKALPRLERVQIPCAMPVDIVCLAEIARSAPRLEMLELNWHAPRNPALLPRVARPFARLKELCEHLTSDLAPIALAEFFEDVLPPAGNISKMWGLVSDVRFGARGRRIVHVEHARGRISLWHVVTGGKPVQSLYPWWALGGRCWHTLCGGLEQHLSPITVISLSPTTE